MLNEFFKQIGDLNWLKGHEIMTAWLVFKAQWDYEKESKQC